MKNNKKEYIHELTVGNCIFKNNIFLAPMAGITDVAFRKMCNKYGAGGTVTEMISANGIVYNDKKTLELLEMFDGESPRVVQLFGNSPDIMKKAVIKLNEMQSVDIIDINMGCPAKKVNASGSGAALLKNLELVDCILKEITSVAKKPISVKTRLGYYMEQPTIFDFVKICNKYAISMITIHGRYKEEYFSNTARYDEIKQVKEMTSIPIIVNGDISSKDKLYEVLEYTRADGAMIGRATMGAPWIFKSMLLDKEYTLDIEERFNVTYEHISLAITDKNEKYMVPRMRKHLSWYLKGLKNSALMREKINRIDTKEILLSTLKTYENQLIMGEEPC